MFPVLVRGSARLHEKGNLILKFDLSKLELPLQTLTSLVGHLKRK